MFFLIFLLNYAVIKVLQSYSNTYVDVGKSKKPCMKIISQKLKNQKNVVKLDPRNKSKFQITNLFKY